MAVKEDAKEQAKQTAEAVKPWVERVSRYGYTAKGVVYATVGVLTGQAAVGVSGTPDGTKGALVEVIVQPFGQILLSIVAAGLAGYVLWRFVQAFADPGRKGTGVMGLIQRAAYVGSGLAYAGMALGAVQLIIGARSGGNGPEDWTARLLGLPYGQWLVGAAGVGVIGIGLSYLYRGYTAQFRNRLKLHQMSDTEEHWMNRSGRFGLAARGFVYVVVGVLIIRAALRFNPEEAGGVGDALRMLARQPYGSWMLAAIALGLIAYGVYAVVMARYRRIYI